MNFQTSKETSNIIVHKPSTRNKHHDIISNKERRLLQSIKNKRSDILPKSTTVNDEAKRKKKAPGNETFTKEEFHQDLKIKPNQLRPNKNKIQKDDFPIQNQRSNTVFVESKKKPLSTKIVEKRVWFSSSRSNIAKIQTDEQVFVTRKRQLKTSEDMILEEMSKYKFRAKPLKKDLFKPQDNNDEKIILADTSTSENNKSNEEEDPLGKVSKNPINHKEKLSNSTFIPRGRNKEPKTYHSFSRDSKLSDEKENIQLILKDLLSKDKIKDKNYIFKARPMPEYRVQEVKKSTSSLTIPNPPNLSCGKKSLVVKK